MFAVRAAALYWTYNALNVNVLNIQHTMLNLASSAITKFYYAML